MAYDQHSQYQPPQRDYYNQRPPPGQGYGSEYGQPDGYSGGSGPASGRRPVPQQRSAHDELHGAGGGIGYANGGHDEQSGYARNLSGKPPINGYPPRGADSSLNQQMNRMVISGNDYSQRPPPGATRSNSSHSSARGRGDYDQQNYSNPHSPAYGQAYSSDGQHYPPRNNGLYADRFQEPQTAPVSPAGRSFPEEPQRSMTMPNDVRGYNGPAGPSPSHPQDNFNRTHSDQQGYAGGHGQPDPYGPPHALGSDSKHSSYDVLDSYYGGPSPGEEMPDFDLQNRKNAGHQRRMSQDRPPNSRAQQGGGGVYYGEPARGNDFGTQAHRSRSQPDLRRQNSGGSGPVVEMPGDVPPMPSAHRDRASPGFDQYGRSQPNHRLPGPARGGYGGPPPRGRGFGGPMPRGGPNMRGPGPGSRGGRPPPPGPSRGHGPPGPYRGQPRGGRGGYPGGAPGRSPDGQDPNRPQTREGSADPDALPHHPAPVRAGLLKGSPVNQQNNAPPPNRPPNSRDSSSSQTSQGRRLSAPPVTLAELEQLSQAVRDSPGDRKTQLTLAKKWVEAASVLADEGGRADPRTRQRNREKYLFDAHKLVKKLVGSGYPAAMFYLADCYGQGLMGLEPDHREAFKLYQSAAKAGHSASAYRTAVCFEMGQDEGGGTTKDPLKAVEWYRRAAAMGDTPAMYKMGMIQLKGLLGQPRNPRDAVNWLKRAADKADEENPHALHELGLLYQNAGPNDSIIRDEAHARQLFFEAAELGYKFSQFRLGAAHEFGYMGCPIDPRTSIAWYSRSAVQEEHQSELALSGWYLTGAEGILQQSDTEAYLWARKAAQAGLAKAEYAMGYFTEVGIGCPSNLEESKRWYQRAAGQNFPKARERLDELRKGGVKVQKSRERLSRSKHTENDCTVM